MITTVTLPVTCHIGLREATFSHENMLVSTRKKYHKTWGALGSDKKLAYNKVCRNTYNYLLHWTGNIMEIIASIKPGSNFMLLQEESSGSTF